jgi:D-sedoheptulose 7-phosphate isomerase
VSHDVVRANFNAAADLIRRSAESQTPVVAEIAEAVVRTYRAGGRVYVFGCGGSAADAQHFATELVGRFQRERRALPCVALTTDTSLLTAVGNDYSFDRVFERQVEAHVEAGDLVIGISTSGNSPSVVAAVRTAKARGATTVGLSGRTGGALRGETDHCLCVDSDVTCRIQEVHEVAIHAICAIVEETECRMPNAECRTEEENGSASP